MRPRVTFSPAQTRAAPGLLAWSLANLAAASEIDVAALHQYEAGAAALSACELAQLGATFRGGGVIAKRPTRLAGEGVRRLRMDPPE